MAATGGRVLALRSVEFARNHQVPLHVRSSFTWEPGTVVTEEDSSVEQPIVSAVTSDTTEAKITITGVPDQPGIAASLFRGLADRAINVDVIVQNTSHHGTTDISFTVPRADLPGSLEVAELLIPQLGAVAVIADDDVATVSLIGAGMRTHPGVTATMFQTLADAGINIEMISTSPDPHLVPGPRRARREGGAGPPRRLRAGWRGRTRPRAARGRPQDLPLSSGHASRGLRRHGTGRCRDEVDPRASGHFPLDSVRFFASARSAGRDAPVRRTSRSWWRTSSAPTSPASTSPLFSCGATTSLDLAPRVAAAGAIVIDNSSAWRMDPEVPLVVPEVNAEALESIPKGIVANPNCTTMVAMPVLKPLDELAGLRRVVAATYQAVSGAGLAGTSELDEQVRKTAEGAAALAHDGNAVDMPAPSKFPAPIAFNVVPVAGQLVADGERGDQRGAEVPRREPQDPRPARPQGLLHAVCGCPCSPGTHWRSTSSSSDRSAPKPRCRPSPCAPGVELCDIPTPLAATGGDVSLVGRIRADATSALTVCRSSSSATTCARAPP